MKCFIHIDKEARAVCIRCGKAMCESCYAYSKHDGVCPECRREDFIHERDSEKIKVKLWLWAMIGCIIIAVFFVVVAFEGVFQEYSLETFVDLIRNKDLNSIRRKYWLMEELKYTLPGLFIVLGIIAYPFFKTLKRRNKRIKRIEDLNNEIDKITDEIENKSGRFL